MRVATTSCSINHSEINGKARKKYLVQDHWLTEEDYRMYIFLNENPPLSDFEQFEYNLDIAVN